MPKTKKPISHKKRTKPTLKSYKKPLIVTLLAIFVTTLILPQIFPYHYYRYIKCGQEPVKLIGRDFSNETANYIAPGDSSYKDYTVFVNGYYCSDIDAEKDGFRPLYLNDGSLNPQSTRL